jgi:hypothetical protein
MLQGGALMMEAVSTSETSLNFYQTTLRNIREDIWRCIISAFGDKMGWMLKVFRHFGKHCSFHLYHLRAQAQAHGVNCILPSGSQLLCSRINAWANCMVHSPCSEANNRLAGQILPCYVDQSSLLPHIIFVQDPVLYFPPIHANVPLVVFSIRVSD